MKISKEDLNLLVGVVGCLIGLVALGLSVWVLVAVTSFLLGRLVKLS